MPRRVLFLHCVPNNLDIIGTPQLSLEELRERGLVTISTLLQHSTSIFTCFIFCISLHFVKELCCSNILKYKDIILLGTLERMESHDLLLMFLCIECIILKMN